MRHIGIVGCSAEGAALCYRTICIEGARRFGGYRHPTVSMHTPPLQDYTDALEDGDLDRVAELMATSGEALAAAGAEFLICPDNTIHAAFDAAAARTRLPWLHIADVLAGAAASAGVKQLAVLGTSWLMESDVYPRALAACGLAAMTPDGATRAELSRIIMEELVDGRITPEATIWFSTLLEDLSARGADGAALACTELPLLTEGISAPLPLFDSTRLLARAALDHAAAL